MTALRIQPVVLAGGGGTRLWPLSREHHPKQFLDLGGGDTLLQETLMRLNPADRSFDARPPLVICNHEHRFSVLHQAQEAGITPGRIILEPVGRNTAAAIALAALYARAKLDPDAVLWVCPSDHLVRDPAALGQALAAALPLAAAGALVTFGITPTRAETGYGYLKCGATDGDGPIRAVEEFAEKPDAARAEAYVRSRQYLWNASMFLWRVDVFLNELARQQPELHAGLRRIAAAWHGPRREERLGEVWPTLKKISVDYAVMEGAAAEGLVATVPGTFGWNDVGDFHTLGDVLPADSAGNVVLDAADAKGEVVLHDSADVVVVPGSRLVAAVGLTDMIIVDTDDALLVCSRGRAQEVKAVVDALRERGATGYL